MFDLKIWVSGLEVVLCISVLTWLISLIKRDVSIVDVVWSLMFLACTLTYFSLAETGPRSILTSALVSIWSIRLALYIFWRGYGESEDYRYQTIRRNNAPNFKYKSLYLIFVFQGLLAWVISLPLLAAIHSQSPLGWLDYVGVFVWSVGILFEVVADVQLTRFRSDPNNHGQVLKNGLWKYSRHPNYFGNACIWWGLFFIAVAAGGWWSVVAPLLMTFLLLRFSGVALLEDTIVERRPGYSDYINSTNAFFPGPSKKV